MVNIHHLELFYYVARYGGISEAVRKIPYGIQQPAVSSQVQQLEEALGVRLFQRRPFQLTPAGEELFGFIAPFFNNLPRVAERLSAKGSRHLRLAASGPALRDHLPALLLLLRKKCPQLQLTLREVNDEEAARLLTAQEFDLALTLIDRAPKILRSQPLLKLTPALVLGVEYSAKYADLNQVLSAISSGVLPVISLPLRERLSQVFSAYMRRAGYDWVPMIETCSFDLIHTYALAGFGVGLTLDTPALLLPEGLKKLPLKQAEKLTLGALWLGQLTPLAREFLSLAEQRALEMSQTPEKAVSKD